MSVQIWIWIIVALTLLGAGTFLLAKRRKSRGKRAGKKGPRHSGSKSGNRPGDIVVQQS